MICPAASVGARKASARKRNTDRRFARISLSSRYLHGAIGLWGLLVETDDRRDTDGVTA